MTKDMLTGTVTDTCTCTNQAAAVQRLVNVLSDDNAGILAARLEEEISERNQFIHIAELLLQQLTPTLLVNAKTYSKDVLHDLDMNVQSEVMGIGSGLT